MPVVLDYKNVSKRYSADSPEFAIDAIDLSVEEGEFVAIVGPSGCGKSTLLNLAAGISRPTEGTVLFRDKPVSGLNTDVGYLTQRHSIFPWRSVRKNVALPLEFRKIPRKELQRRVDLMLDLVGLSAYADAYPAQLSGGMQQRVAIARIFAYRPSTYLLDEPFGALDAQLRIVMQSELLNLWRETGGTMLFVTHDLAEAVALADRVVVLSRHPGRIKDVVSVSLGRPRDVAAIQGTEEFGTLLAKLWSMIDLPELSSLTRERGEHANG